MDKKGQGKNQTQNAKLARDWNSRTPTGAEMPIVMRQQHTGGNGGGDTGAEDQAVTRETKGKDKTGKAK